MNCGIGGGKLYTLPHQYFSTACCKPTTQPVTRWHILKLKCTECDFGWGSSGDSLAGFQGLASKENGEERI